MNNIKIGAALVGGYLLGRTKKVKLAIGLGMFLAGKKLSVDPRQLGKLVAGSPLLGGLNDQVRKELVNATKSAATSALTKRANGFADSLRERTLDLNDPSRRRDDDDGDERSDRDARDRGVDEQDVDDRDIDEGDLADDDTREDKQAPRRRASSAAVKSATGKTASGARRSAAGSAKTRKSTSSSASGRGGAGTSTSTVRKTTGAARKTVAGAHKSGDRGGRNV